MRLYNCICLLPSRLDVGLPWPRLPAPFFPIPTFCASSKDSPGLAANMLGRICASVRALMLHFSFVCGNLMSSKVMCILARLLTREGRRREIPSEHIHLSCLVEAGASRKGRQLIATYLSAWRRPARMHSQIQLACDQLQLI